jgi:catechol 2,3-dioxygenase-like lactoylglutathione lyase family enzyme
MFSHVGVGSNDLARSQRFYDAVLVAVLGAAAPVRNQAPSGHTRLFYRHGGNTFIVTEPINGEPATFANGGTIGFTCQTPEQVQAFHDAAIVHGGRSIEDPPGLRGSGLYLAYVRDPDGNKLCALCRVPQTS